MALRSILVDLDIDRPSTDLVKCAAGMARRFGAELIGFAAAPLSEPIIGIEGSAVFASYGEKERKDLELRLRDLEDQFRLFASSVSQLSWYSFMASPASSVISLASRADLIMIASQPAGESTERSVDIGDLVLSAGRPVIVAGKHVAEISADKIVIGWKDTREARRAVMDALPLLEAATDVHAVTIDEGDLATERSGLDKLLAWGRGHGIKIRGDVYPIEAVPGEMLANLAREAGADLVVTGAYGHSRLREWLLGGVTDDLLSEHSISRFMSN